MESARQKLAAEQLIKLIEVKAINATAMSLTWKRQKNEPLVQGYYIKWRGPPLTPDHSWVNVSDPRTQTVLINGLKPFTNYEFFVIPYHRTIQGMPSNSLDGTTYEAPPSLPPTNVRVRMLNLTTLRVLWRPPTADGINGILKGYQILIIGNTTEYSRNISTNERAASVTLFHLNPGKTYKVRVAAKTLAGIGVYHGTDTVTMNEDTLREHLRLANEGSDEGIWYILRRPWAIALLGIILWLIIVAFAVLVWYRWKNRRGKAGRNGMPFIKINDGSVLFTARDGFWLTGQHYGQHNQAQSLHSDQTNPMTPNQSEYYAAGPIPHLARAPYPGTLARTQSPHHYHYAQLPEGCLQNGMSTFYGMGRPEYQDDPSPYATTTLVMNGHSNTQPRFKRHDSANLHSPLPQPRLPTGPIPSGPPQHLLATVASNGSSGDGIILSDGYPTNKRGYNTQQELCQLGNGMNPRSSSRGALAGFHNSNSLHSSDSPHTDVSFVQSSDGTNGSGKGRTMNRGSPPRHILDFVPPPPPTEPPPHFDHTDVSNGYRPDYRDANHGRKLTSGGENYDSVSDLLLAQNNGYHPSPQPRDHSLYNGHSQHASTSTPKQFAKNRSRNGLRKYEKNGRRSRGTDDDESQRSSLMGGDEDDADDEGGIASHQITYDSDMDGGELSDGEVGTNRKSRRSNADSSFTYRPNVPVMGVSASTLSQSSCK
uniref:Fibronectin type-III domain-containing protein n=1 Tax=Acrobeloides nanus TaxID=290746 RepID=A0A914CTM8_9BILA